MKYTLYIREIVSNRIFESKFEKEEKFRENASIHKETRATFYPNFRIRGQKKKKKKKKMSKPRKLEAEVSFFAFATVNVFRSGILAEGRWAQPRRNGPTDTTVPLSNRRNSTETSDGPRMIRDD